MNTVHSQLRFRISWDNDHKNNSNSNCVCICVHMLACKFVCVFMHTWHGGQWTSLWNCFSLSTMYGFWGVWESRWFLCNGKETIRTPSPSWESIFFRNSDYLEQGRNFNPQFNCRESLVCSWMLSSSAPK